MKFNTLRNGALACLCAIAALAIVAPNANAQDPRRGYNVGVGSLGTDMTTQAMSGLRLFTPHRNNCDDTTTPTEAFVKIYTNSNNVDFGFCIDIDEHSSGSKEWEDARLECLDDGKRLPEPGEFKLACDAAGTLGLNNMTDDWEWSSNYWLPHRLTYAISGSYHHGQITTRAGGGGCKAKANAWIGNTLSGSDSFVFRCVR